MHTWLIGAAPECDLVVDQPTVSGHHCLLSQTGEGWLLEDLHSRNGTYVNGRKISQPTVVLSADKITLGRMAAMPWPEPSKTQNWDRPEDRFQSIPIRERTTVFGRDGGCDRVLDDPMVSRRHARLTRSGDVLSIEDLGSTNGTFLNGRRILEKTAVQLGDMIAIGRFAFKITSHGQFEQRDYRGNVTIEAQGVTVEARDRRLLEAISLTVYPSEFVALMGPSGAGKTTLMNALNGYTPPATGTVLFNGQDLYANYGQFQGVIGYVPQDDIMHGDLTVGQALYYTARLRLPADSSDEEIAQRVQKVIAQLGLQGTENVLIGSPQKKGISGGQRKRVNLAMELLTDPAVLFLDEPTSGLSSEDALNVMRLLRRLANEGKTILLTIHQPSLEAYRLLDNLILVAKDPATKDPGRLVYYGPAYPQAVEFFNPAQKAENAAAVPLSPDEVLRGLAKDRTQAWAERYAVSPWKKQFVDDRAGKQTLPAALPLNPKRQRYNFGFRQWWTLLCRSLTIKRKDAVNTAILMAQAPIIAMLIVFVFGGQASKEANAENWASVAGATSTTVFLMSLAALWFGCSNSAREIVGEWAIYYRERMVNLKIPSYVGSKFAVLGSLCLIQCAVLLGVVYWGAGLHGPLWAMFLMILLISSVGLALGLTISALARTSEVAIALLPLILLPMVILAGVLQPLHKMNGAIAALAQVMPSRWAFEGLLLLEANHHPTWTPPVPQGMPGTPTLDLKNQNSPSTEVPKNPDMAENFFPAKTDRIGVTSSAIILGAMLLILVTIIHGVLLSRDVH